MVVSYRADLGSQVLEDELVWDVNGVLEGFSEYAFRLCFDLGLSLECTSPIESALRKAVEAAIADPSSAVPFTPESGAQAPRGPSLIPGPLGEGNQE